LELPLLELATGLECLEELLDGPAGPIAVDDERDRFVAVDRQVGQQEPLDGRLACRRLALEYMDHVEPQRRRLFIPGICRALQLDRRCSEAQPGDAMATGGVALSLWSFDLGPGRQRNVTAQRYLGSARGSA